MEKTDIKNLTLSGLEAFISGLGKERFRAKQIFKWLYQMDAMDFDEMTNVSKEFRAVLKERAEISNLSPEAVEASEDGTRKYLFRLKDGAAVESVLIPDEGRNTLCISSQVGCAMQCAFCLTGTFGLSRNLTTSEIVNQVCAVKREHPVNNIVFMGMGEPLANLSAVIPAVQILTDPDGFQLSTRKVTVSTSGLVPEMAELGRGCTVNLAVSLNATTDEVRDRIMPVNRAYPLKELLAACKAFPLPSRRWITIEYVMIRDLNDTLDDAKRLVRLISNIPSKVNLIPFNEHDGCAFKSPTQETIDRFHKYLLDKHVTVITRSSRGGDISAACGQLKGKLDQMQKD
ncbi:23S rRNA (adenine(2503)-C(2))-methyltransferase RlmN [Geomonas sp. Red69]|uniref:Probable dual-specificity RNA methyltransferase RlmN n=1 Tax=Geomonas diazotrophica TaxID=2843197 RepID=A0ABX8JBW7_9BACT|nr:MULTISPECIES: 23S rRNA (adenine(2503)-C(2))-methyltransferase RlmN [Geomonas]MBU5638201.1 23S rRNA (adenine(2503)-C(2))-methyltransferase RlmN [Geomonas diazotrophica]QWV95920.1 23S rRNA (adenine(2503)-C(2))-methyltransferase RlmN [Geomonas nitrogeniifigens]QXE85006.1 23S rRNA (adenine(2503)-C(2))-methyltransferase RlmN [Geomonas nitrogeniifigens]